MADLGKIERSPRQELTRKIEFIIDEDIIKAKSINISETGIRFDTDEPISILMRMHLDDGETEDHKAELVWVKKGDDGGSSYGLRYTSDDRARLSDDLVIPED